MGGQGQPKWNIYEAVILLDAWLKTQQGEDMQNEIKRVSKALRQLAINRNLEINEVYRNISGITLQMLRMKDTFVGENSNGRASKLFMQVVAMYKENKLEYDRYLKEAKEMIYDKTDISNKSDLPPNVQQIPLRSQVDFLNFENTDDLANSKPVALYYRDYIMSNILSWYDLYLKFKMILEEINPDILKFDCSIDNNEDSAPIDIVLAIKTIFKFFDLDISELCITYKKINYYDSSRKSKEIIDDRKKNIEPMMSKEELADKCITILNSDFEDGFIIGNYMHKMRFLASYEGRYGSDISAEIDNIDNYLSGLGRIVDDRVYAPTKKTNSKVLDIIFDDIITAFSKLASVISVECIFDKYSRELASEMNIYNSETLLAVLKSDNRFTKNYVINNSSITELNSEMTLIDEVKKRLKNSSIPVTAVELNQTMWYVSVEKIKTVLRQLPEAVYVDASAYFYGPNFYISSEEKNELIKSMHNEIYSNGYIVTSNLREIFRKSCPSAAMDSENFKDYGIRQLIKYVIGDKFEFNVSVITEKGSTLDLRQIFRDFASEHEKLTLSEIKTLQEDVGLTSLNTTYWNAILDETIRISNTEFVRKDLINFDVKSVDEVLDVICPDSYIALKDIDLFLSFPAIQYRWNGFVLESYLRNYSEKYCLLQVSVSAENYHGVMVKKNSGFETYEDVAADMLSKSTEWNDETTALKLLSSSGFQQRAKNKNITTIVKRAKALRENN